MRRSPPSKLRQFLANESGATSIEYAMIASGIACAIVAVIATMGTSVKGMYQTLSDKMN